MTKFNPVSPDKEESYKKSLSKSLQDKLFFTKFDLGFDCCLDFGCAQGLLTRELSNKGIRAVGYDLWETCLDEARKGCDSLFTSCWEEAVEATYGQKSAFVASSVMHEVYSYGDVDEFWQRFHEGNFKYFIMRDMIRPKRVLLEASDISKVMERANQKTLHSFEETWGDFYEDPINYLHYLLKYRYESNWDREVKENYLPFTLDEISKRLGSGYRMMYVTKFKIPQLEMRLLRDFGVRFPCDTHIKMVCAKV